jgi:hypothetical protein
MLKNIRVVHAHDFIKATPEGKLDFEETNKLLIEIVAASACLEDYNIILDTRKAQSTISVNELWVLASNLGSSFLKEFHMPQKTAVLCPAERFNHAEFFAVCANNRGFNVSAFTSVENAYEWLIEDRG